MFTVMLADDEEWALKGALSTFPFERHGFLPVLATTDPVEAQSFLLEKKPDLVIADVRMPELSGLDLLGSAREAALPSLFVLLSGYSEFAYAQKAVSLGAFEYCLKPIKEEDAGNVLARAATAIRGRHGLGEKVAEPLPENEGFRMLLRYLEEHFREPVQQAALCERFGLHPSYCSRLFAKTMNCGFAEHLTKLRLMEAKRLLTAGGKSVAEVAELCGYQDYYYFTKVYTRYFGISPSKARKASIHG